MTTAMREWTENPQTDVAALAHRWWTLAIRGAAAIVFGILTLFAPSIGLVALITLFGVYALVDGVFNIAAGIRRARMARSWGWLVFEGIASVGAGIVTFIWPVPTALVLLMIIGAWALVTGIAEIAAAIRLRKEIRGEWLLGLSGTLSITFGVLMLLFPGAGALAVMLWIGAYALVFGSLLVGLAFRLRAWSRRTMEERHFPPGGVPATA